MSNQIQTFQVINQNNDTVMTTSYVGCIPTDKELSSMYKAGYKFKLNGKAISLKKVLEIKKEK